MRNAVIGQTGNAVLSEDAIHRRVLRTRTVRYQYQKVKSGWMAWVCGPFHSGTYGACSFGTDKRKSKAALQRRLANDYRYLGRLMYSDADAASEVGNETRIVSVKEQLKQHLRSYRTSVDWVSGIPSHHR